MLSISITILGAWVTTANGVGFMERFTELVGLLRSSGQSDIAMQTIDKLQLLAQTSPNMESLDQALRTGVSDIEANVEQRIADDFEVLKSAIVSQQTRFEDQNLIFEDTSKPNADQADEKWYDCVAVEKSATFSMEQATQQYQTAVQQANEACQNRDRLDSWTTSFTANDFKFTCDAKVGDCDAELQTYLEVLSSEKAQRGTSLQTADELYKVAETACVDAEKTKAEALVTKNTASSTLTSQIATCAQLEVARYESMCTAGSDIMLTCTEVSKYDALKQTNMDNQVVREKEWTLVHMTKCILTKGASVSPLGSDTLQDCREEDDYAGKVGTLTYTDTSLHWCNSGATSIPFFGKTWTRDDPPTSEGFEAVDYAPSYPSGSKPFEFCLESPPTHGKPPPEGSLPDCYKSRPKNRECRWMDTLLGENLGTGSHSFVMALWFSPDSNMSNNRQWIFNMGQQGTGAEHWLWRPYHNKTSIQFGSHNDGHSQLRSADISKAKKTLATTYDGKTKSYKLYLDGKLIKTGTEIHLNIKSNAMLVGMRKQGDFRGCIGGVDVYRTVLQADNVQRASDRIWDETLKLKL